MEADKGNKFVTQATVGNPRGLHMREIGEIVKVAKNYHATVRLTYNGRSGAAHETLNIMCLAVPHNGIIDISSEGDDAEIAAGKIVDILENFQE